MSYEPLDDIHYLAREDVGKEFEADGEEDENEERPSEKSVYEAFPSARVFCRSLTDGGKIGYGSDFAYATDGWLSRDCLRRNSV